MQEHHKAISFNMAYVNKYANAIPVSRAKYRPSTPVRIRLLNRRISILKGAYNVTALFKNSRKLSSERWIV
jgi:hypothetical protein